MNLLLDTKDWHVEADGRHATPRARQNDPGIHAAPSLRSSIIPELAVPRRGHVLSRVAEQYGEPLREAVAVIAGSLARKKPTAELYEGLFLHPDIPMSGRKIMRPHAEMAAWSIVSMWVTGIAAGEFPVGATLTEAEKWFFGNTQSEHMTGLLSASATAKAEAFLREEADASAYKQLMPYILDPHGPGSRLSVRRNPGTRAARDRKRAEGVFYTPADVAHYMAATSLDSVQGKEPPTIFDPACGTGVFLRAALAELADRHPDHTACALAKNCLFGTDIDPWPLDAVAFILLCDIRSDGEKHDYPPFRLWRRLRENFACVDTLRIDPVLRADSQRSQQDAVGEGQVPSRITFSQLFPTLGAGPQVIIGNPPYADLGQRDDFDVLGATFRTLAVKAGPSAEIYLPFVEQMVRLTGSGRTAGALVLPLSIASNIGAQFAEARTMIANTPGTWRFAFFDREPHALFGEDVKTRNAILLWSKGEIDTRCRLATGPLRKWRGDSRALMFNSLRFTSIESDIRTGIPKVDGACQASALDNLSQRWSQLEQAVSGFGRASLDQAPHADDRTVFVGPTAYNFLNVFLKPPRGLLSAGQALSEHPLHVINCVSRKDALAVFAMLSSHLAYWWWHTHGDGFHVSRRMLATFPFGMETLTGGSATRLAESGEELWNTICKSPIMSLNRGKTSLAFTPNGHDGMRRKADEILAGVANLEKPFVDELQHFTAHTVAAILRAHGSDT